MSAQGQRPAAAGGADPNSGAGAGAERGGGGGGGGGAAAQQQAGVPSHSAATGAHVPSPARATLLADLHRAYVKSLESDTSFEHAVSAHLRLSGVYWGLCAMATLGALEQMDCEGVAAWLLRCQHPCGGFGGDEGHDPHLLYTLSAVQIMCLLGRERELDGERIARYVANLQRPDGSFVGDEWGEVDTRFTYCALSCLNLLDQLHGGHVDVDKATAFVARCRNFDGGFGVTPGGESHAGQIFTAVGALAIGGALHHVESDVLGWWLCERQTAGGGLNGRPEKLQDVCYSWWVLSALAVLGRLEWIDKEALQAFILDCQDEHGGGISDRPEDQVDVFHTFFGVAGLSLMGYEGLKPIDPMYALPVETVERVFAGRPKTYTRAEVAA